MNKKLKVALALLVLLGSLYLSRKPIMTAAAAYLEEAESPRQADLVVVLGGDPTGARGLKGCELLQKGYANEMWVSGSTSFYGKTEGSLTIDFLRERGCPVDRMKALDNPVDSTRDEAIAIGRMMRERQFRRYLLVTSNYHTRRAGRAFRSASPGQEAIVVSADDNNFHAGNWWETRHSRKIFFYEWLKTVSYWAGM